MNTELFRRIDALGLTDENHDQSTWEGASLCGITRCVAGWAVSLTIDAPLWEHGPDEQFRPSSNWGESPQFREALDRAGVFAADSLARLYLGLSYAEACALFFSEDGTARAVVRDLARGDRSSLDRLVRDRIPSGVTLTDPEGE